MKKLILCLVCTFFLILVQFGDTSPAFADYFQEKALRLDLYQTGDAQTEIITLQRLTIEPKWSESRKLIDPFGYGRYMLKLFTADSDNLIYSRGFDCIFGEYRTTDPALRGVMRTFARSMRIPLPRQAARLSIERRDRQNQLHQVFSTVIDPHDYHLQTEIASDGKVFEIMLNGDPREKVDLLFIAEGYTVEDEEKFKSDCHRFTDALFNIEPYKSRRESFNIRGLFQASAERGMDEPRQGKYRNTLLDASFNAFDLDRYLLSEAGHRLRRVASRAPYDTLVILVNSSRYGGGGIYNDYCITTVDHDRSLEVFLHELGHSFGGLADEYYTSEVSYNEFYPPGVEPLEPNITALLDPGRVKWAEFLSPGIQVPTEYGKEERDRLQAEKRLNQKKKEEETKKAASDAAKKRIEDRYQKIDRRLAAKLESLARKYRSLEDKVGVFEGAGYAAKGLYRPMMHCLMISHPKNEFCLVCRQAIAAMIDYYAGSQKKP